MYSILLLALVGCSGLLNQHEKVVGKQTKQTTILAQKIAAVDNQKADLNEERLTSIGNWSAGVDYSLQQDTNQSPAVEIATDFNHRVSALANKPDFEEAQALYDLVNTLLTNKIAGEKILAAKDEEIIKLGLAIQKLETDKEKLVDKTISQSTVNAAQADKYKQTISELDSFWGGGAIWYGLKKMANRLLWVVGGGLLIYLVLRAAAVFSPVASAAFSVINTIFGAVIKAIQTIAPQAAKAAGFIEQSIFNGYEKTLTHIIHTIQLEKEKEKAGANITMDNLMADFSTVMDETDKNRIKAIKKKLNFN